MVLTKRDKWFKYIGGNDKPRMFNAGMIAPTCTQCLAEVAITAIYYKPDDVLVIVEEGSTDCGYGMCRD